MNNGFSETPASYLNELQRIEREQELAKLRTLSLEFAGVLDFFPKLREELDAFYEAKGIAFDGLTNRLRPIIKQAADIQFEIEHLSADLRDASEMKMFEQQVKQTMNLGSIQRVAAQFKATYQGVCEDRNVQIKAAIPEMVSLPSGIFTMGCVSGWLGFGNRDCIDGDVFESEKPAHKVSISSFLIGKYPVTFAQFDIFCDLTGFAKPSDSGWGRGLRPVINVSWDDVQHYLNWLIQVTGQRYRLPSEAEWEYSARGGDYLSAFPWGMKAKPRYANYNYGLNAVRATTPVGQFPANGFGLYDMHGNVEEWCQDTAHDNYHGAPSTNTAWVDENSTSRVVRGGSWNSYDELCRSADRKAFFSSYKGNFIGFRLVLDQV